MAAHEAVIRDAEGVNKPPDQRLPAIVIQPTSGWAALRLGEIWRYRELLYFLTWRDLKLRYKQTLIGAAWAVIQPLMTMAVFAVIFGRLVGVPSDGLPYPVFAYAALVPWTLFAMSMTQAGMSLEEIFLHLTTTEPVHGDAPPATTEMTA